MPNLNPITTTKIKATKQQTDERRRCVYCGQKTGLVWVHGHGQCAGCGINVEECCRGEHCDR